MVSQQGEIPQTLSLYPGLSSQNPPSLILRDTLITTKQHSQLSAGTNTCTWALCLL